MSDAEHTQDLPDIEDARRVPLAGLLEAAHQAFFAEFNTEIAKQGYGDVRPGHGCVFRFVRDEGLRLTDIARMANITKQSAGEAVDDLTRRGYVMRIPDPADRRAKLVCLTERGAEAQRAGFDLFGELEERWAERYGPERVAELRQVLEQIVTREAPERVPELARPEPTEPEPAGAR